MTATRATPVTIQGTRLEVAGALIPGMVVPQWWQNWAPGVRAPAHLGHLAPARAPPQCAQNLPEAASPQRGQGVGIGR